MQALFRAPNGFLRALDAGPHPGGGLDDLLFGAGEGPVPGPPRHEPDVSAASQNGGILAESRAFFGTGVLSDRDRIIHSAVFWIAIACLRAPERGKAGCIAHIEGPFRAAGPLPSSVWPGPRNHGSLRNLPIVKPDWRRRLFSRPRSLAAHRRFVSRRRSRRPCSLQDFEQYRWPRSQALHRTT